MSSHPRFDVGPILNQELHQVPENCTAEELGATLATKGAHLVSCLNTAGRRLLLLPSFQGGNIAAVCCLYSGLQLLDTLMTLSEKLAQKREQRRTGETFGT